MRHRCGHQGQSEEKWIDVFIPVWPLNAATRGCHQWCE